MKTIWIGTSGWSYAHWDQVFYSGIPPNQRLNHYAHIFKTVEVNTTFYHLVNKKTVKHWVLQVPRRFIFSVKASRYITHIKRLKDCAKSLRLVYQEIRPFGKKLGPILFQLPPSFEKNIERLKNFIDLLKPRYKYVFEFRSSSWYDQEVYDLLKKKKIALCISDLDGYLSPIELTADFVYIRLHGPAKAYQGRYGRRALITWAQRIKKWKQKNLYIYFDNDEKGYAVQDAQELLHILK